MSKKSKLANFYNQFSLIILNLLLFIILLNIICLIVFGIIRKEKNPLNKYNVEFNLVYPDLTKDQLSQLMNETYGHGVVFDSFTQFKERPRNGKYVNVEKEGFRRTINQGPWPPSKKYYNIFLFGGSTTFGYGLPDYETIASYLQQLISKHLNMDSKVYNFGRGYYYSTQERILFEELLSSGIIPNCVIFIDGLNDSGYKIGELQFKDLLSSFLSNPHSFALKYLFEELPIIKAITKVANLFINIPIKANINLDYINNIIRRYTLNKNIIDGLCIKYNIKSIFVWQPIPMYKYDMNYHLFVNNHLVNHPSKYVYPYMKKYIENAPLGNNFLWCADFQEKVKKPLYVDIVHYSSFMSEMFSKEIIKIIEDKELLLKK